MVSSSTINMTDRRTILSDIMMEKTYRKSFAYVNSKVRWATISHWTITSVSSVRVMGFSHDQSQLDSWCPSSEYSFSKFHILISALIVSFLLSNLYHVMVALLISFSFSFRYTCPYLANSTYFCCSFILLIKSKLICTAVRLRTFLYILPIPRLILWFSPSISFQL